MSRSFFLIASVCIFCYATILVRASSLAGSNHVNTDVDQSDLSIENSVLVQLLEQLEQGVDTDGRAAAQLCEVRKALAFVLSTVDGVLQRNGGELSSCVGESPEQFLVAEASAQRRHHRRSSGHHHRRHKISPSDFAKKLQILQSGISKRPLI